MKDKTFQINKQIHSYHTILKNYNLFNAQTNQFIQESNLNESLFFDSTDSGQEQLTGQVEKYFGCMLCLGYFSRNEMYSLTECEHLVCKSCGQNELKKAKGKNIRCHCKAFVNTRPNKQKVSEIKAKSQNKTNVKHQAHESRIDQQQCKICSQFHHKTSFLSIYECEHESCQNCLKDVVKDCIDNSKQIKCSFGCGSGYNLGSNFINKLDQKYQAKYKNLQFIWFTQKQGLKRCPSQKCKEGILIELLEFYECSSCFKRYCVSCEWPQHRGACSSAADNYIDNYLLFAQCLKCKSRIQKNNGCNHMQCRCGHNFCYQCLGNWSSDHTCPRNNKRKFTIQVKNENINHPMTESILETQVNKRAKILGLELQDAKSLINDRGMQRNNWEDENVNQIRLMKRRVGYFDEQDREQRRRKYEEGLERQLKRMTHKQSYGNLQHRPQVIKNHQFNLSIKDKCTQDHVKHIFYKNNQIVQSKQKPILKQKVTQDIRGQQSSIANHQKRYEKPKANNVAHLISSISF